MNKFVFIVPFYNAANYIRECLDSLLNQDFPNWRAVLIDDCSWDNTVSRIDADKRISVIVNTSRYTALPNIHNAIMSAGLEEEDIICLLDGDDKLNGHGVCTLINDLYLKYDPLLTYGQYITSEGLTGHCSAYDRISFRNLRSSQYRASHLRTFKYKLYKQILAQDPHLSCYKSQRGEVFTMAYDVAMMTPMLEIAGLERIAFNPEPVYYYRVHANNDHMLNSRLQTTIAHEIYAKPRFRQVF